MSKKETTKKTGAKKTKTGASQSEKDAALVAFVKKVAQDLPQTAAEAAAVSGAFAKKS